MLTHPENTRINYMTGDAVSEDHHVDEENAAKKRRFLRRDLGLLMQKVCHSYEGTSSHH